MAPRLMSHALNGRDHATDVDHGVGAQGVEQPLGPQYGAAHRITVTVDELGERVHDQVGAVGERAVERWWGEGGVDAEQGARVVRDPGEGRDVADAGRRVGDHLGVHELRVRPQRGPHGVRVAGVDEGGVHVVAGREDVGEQPPDRLVGDVGDDGVLAGAQQREEDGVQCSDAGGEHDRVLGLLERGQLALQRELVGAGVAGVERDVVARPAQPRRVVGQGVGVGHHQRRADRPGSDVDRRCPRARPGSPGRASPDGPCPVSSAAPIGSVG